MEEKFFILGSSSNGNSAFLNTGKIKILIDAGFSAKNLEERLMKIGESVENLDAVFLTHEHSDHAIGVRGLSKLSKLPFYANRDTAYAIQSKIKRNINWRIFDTGSEFRLEDMAVKSYSIPHDAYDPVGFSFFWGNENDLFYKPNSLAWITDLGYIPNNVRLQILQVNNLVIESNFEPNLLAIDKKRPWSIKQRIRGRHGHLSNKDTYEFLDSVINNSKLEKIYLAHLSKDCNRMKDVLEKSKKLIQKYPHLEIVVIDPNQ